ncbi:hypothetical protein H0H81_001891 [Sphagnurus paluster]|uniref:Cytochrome P450 n=1 Tax=Sphagnurus paluster TaxID=117069 RepID=A0A9P7KKI1_9AGAR|nr:hypothetical protein H0H81_001891 [Sphagnurus paluster]
MGWKKSLGFLPYGKDFQRHRRIFQEYFSKNATNNYQSIQLREARLLAQNLAAGPSDLDYVLNRFSAAIIMGITYGQQIKSDDDPFVKLVNEVGIAFTHAGSIGANVLDIFPFLRYMPSWFPGTYYANFARKNASKVRRMYDYPFEVVQEQMSKGTAKHSLVSYYTEALNSGNDLGFEFDAEDIKGAAATTYMAGTETTASSLSIFILAMILYPDFQTRAQEELDRVVGVDRLPEFSDRPSLPYLEYVLHETLR